MSTPDLQDRPQIAVNFAITWDGRISTRNSTPSDFSSPRDKHRLLEIRATGDAVMASVKTIAADRMTMGLPDEELRRARVERGQQEFPIRVLLTGSGHVDPALPVFAKTFSPIVILTSKRMPVETESALAGKASIRRSSGNTVDLQEAMAILRRDYGVKRLVCEGGGQVLHSLLAAGLVDEINLTICPQVFGGAEAPTITGRAGAILPKSTRCDLESMEEIEGECFLRYRVLPSTIE